jgi:tetratricopeptide (TPR) repeat protein
MSLRFRRSMKLMPGVRLSFNKDSVGMSFGVPGARYTINSKGRRTVSTGIPGTGLYNVETLSSGKRTASATSTQSTGLTEMRSYDPPTNLRPHLFSRKAERELYKFLLDIFKWDEADTPDQVIEKATKLQTLYPSLGYSLDLIKFLFCVKGSTIDDAVGYQWGKDLWSNRQTVFSDKYVVKYLQGITPQVPITSGISTSSIYNDQTLGHILVELFQHMKKIDEALAVLHEMDPDQLVAISMADLEIGKKDYDGAIETTEDIENEDDATAMMLILRGVAFREKGMEDASLECLKRALASKKRSETLLHRALFERAETYTRLGKKAMAIKDLEKILVDDSDYPAVQEKLDALNVK